MALFALFLVVELTFLFANVLKIPDGGWFPLAAGATCLPADEHLEARRAVAQRAHQRRGHRTRVFIDALLVSMPCACRARGVHDVEQRPRAERHAAQPDAQQGAARAGAGVSVEVFDVPYVPEIDRVEITAEGRVLSR
jgi:KUP system potassium uptake protein